MNRELTVGFVPKAIDYCSILSLAETVAKLETIHLAGPPSCDGSGIDECLFVDACPLLSSDQTVTALAFTRHQEPPPLFGLRAIATKTVAERYLHNPRFSRLLFDPSPNLSPSEESMTLGKVELALLHGFLSAKSRPSPCAHLHEHARSCLAQDRISEAFFWATKYRLGDGVLEAFLEIVVACLSHLGLYLEAKAEISSYREPGRGNLDLTVYEARILTLRGFPHDAIGKLKTVFAGFRVSSLAWIERARALAAIKQYAQAKVALDKAFHEDPKSFEARFLQVSMCSNEEKFKEFGYAPQTILEFIDELLEHSSDRRGALYRLKAIAFSAIGETDKAYDYFSKALMEGSDLSSYHDLIPILESLGEKEKSQTLKDFLDCYYPPAPSPETTESAGDGRNNRFPHRIEVR